MTTLRAKASAADSAADGLNAFKNAVNATAGLAKEDAAILIEVRSNLIVGCSATTPPGLKPPQGLRSALAPRLRRIYRRRERFLCR